MKKGSYLLGGSWSLIFVSGALIDSLLNSLPIRKSYIVQELIFLFLGYSNATM